MSDDDNYAARLSENDLTAVEDRVAARRRLMDDDYACGKDVDQQLDILAVPILSAAGSLAVEAREHRALLADVRIVHSGDQVSLTDYHDALRRIREALAKEDR